MSDSENVPKAKGIKEGNFAGMPQQDVDFLVACLRNTVGGSIIVNTIKAAEALEYKNHRSITNRIKQMKDKYGLAMSGTTKRSTDNISDDVLGEEIGTAPFEASSTKKTPKSTVKKTPAAKGTPKTPIAKAKAPAANKRKAAAISNDVSFPGLESGGDADVSGDSAERLNNTEEDEEEDA